MGKKSIKDIIIINLHANGKWCTGYSELVYGCCSIQFAQYCGFIWYFLGSVPLATSTTCTTVSSIEGGVLALKPNGVLFLIICKYNKQLNEMNERKQWRNPDERNDSCKSLIRTNGPNCLKCTTCTEWRTLESTVWRAFLQNWRAHIHCALASKQIN